VPLTATYLNEAIELLEGEYGDDRRRQLESLSRVYNPRLGPLTTVSLHRPELLELSMYGATSRHAPIGGLVPDARRRGVDGGGIVIPCGGKGATMQQALLGTFGEAAERLLAVLHSTVAYDDVVYGTHEQLVREKRRAIGPEELPLFAPEQYELPDFPFAPFEPDAWLAWVEGTELGEDEPVLVPAQLALFYWSRHPRERRIGYATSGGLAFHTDRRLSILHGLYEVIERDAANLRWYCRLPPPRVDVDLEALLAEQPELPVMRLATPALGALSVLLNTVDVQIPVFVVTAVAEERRDRAFLAGGGAWSRRTRALTQALFEIGQMQTGYRLFPHDWDHIRPESDRSQLTDFFHAPVYYGHPETLGLTRWYTDGGERMSWDAVPSLEVPDVDAEYDAIVGDLRAAGIRPIALDFGSACWPGGALTKVFVPQLTQAHIPSHPFLGHPRFREVPRRIGALDRDLTYDELLTYPLPFP
jgi:ribosomal protein S12 methylthiotransferase accessory factor